jgi:hypothetical protein
VIRNVRLFDQKRSKDFYTDSLNHLLLPGFAAKVGEADE